MGENLPSVYIDELVPGRDLSHILKDPTLKGRVNRPARLEDDVGREQGKEEDFEDD